MAPDMGWIFRAPLGALGADIRIGEQPGSCQEWTRTLSFDRASAAMPQRAGRLAASSTR